MANENKYVIVVRHLRDLENDLRRKKLKNGRQWNDLPEDLVGEIMVRLSSADSIRLAACCKKFRSLMPCYYNPVEFDRFPWLVILCTGSSSQLIKLFDPIHQTPYSVTCFREIAERLSRDRMRLLCCKNGWLLLLGRKHLLGRKQIHLEGRKQIHLEAEERKFHRLLSSPVLVSPFTKQISALPDIDHTSFVGDDRYPSGYMISSYSGDDPLSPDCVYFVLWDTNGLGKVQISTFRNCDTEWNTIPLDIYFLCTSVVYHEGIFYCVSIDCHIVAYRVVENQCGFITPPAPVKRHKNCNRNPYLLVCDGKLVLVFLDVPFSEKTDEAERCIIFEYDMQQEGNWTEKTNVGDNALYLSHVGSFSVSTSSHDMANKIYYVTRCGGDHKYYSLEDNKAYWCEPSCWPGVEGWGTWIEPPQLHSHVEI